MLIFILRTFFLSSMLLTFQSLAAAPVAGIYFDAPCDFSAISVDIREQHNPGSDDVALNIILNPSARDKLHQFSLKYMNSETAVYINNVKTNTATIRAELNSDSYTFIIDRKTAGKIFPALLNNVCHRKE